MLFDIIPPMSVLRTRTPHVIVHLEGAVKTQRELIQGILSYVQQNNPWVVTLITGQSKSEPKLTPTLLESADGYIGHGVGPRVMDLVESYPLAVLYSRDTPPKQNRCRPATIIGSIGCDNRQVGTAAADYFLEKGFSSFAYIGSATPLIWSEDRQSAFRSRLRNQRRVCRAFSETSGTPSHQRKVLSDWLANLPAQTAVFVANDALGQQVLNICANTGIAVPGRLAVLACDDEEIVCETALPTLSSIRLDTERIGFAAAEQMDRFFLDGQRPDKPIRFLYGVSGISERASTRTVRLTDDPLVERARTYIRLNVGHSIRVKILAQALNVSQRSLEMHFRQTLGRSVRDEIADQQLEQTKLILSKDSLSLEEIAERCGYSSASHLCTFFKRRLGMTPGAWQRESLR